MSNPQISGEELFNLVYQLRYRCTDNDEHIRSCTDLSPAEYRALKNLEVGETLSAAQFADKVGLSPSRCSRVIDKMERAGSITIRRSEQDRRTIFISLAPEGEEIKNDIDGLTKSCHAKLDEGLSEKDREEIHLAIQKLLQFF